MYSIIIMHVIIDVLNCHLSEDSISLLTLRRTINSYYGLITCSGLVSFRLLKINVCHFTYSRNQACIGYLSVPRENFEVSKVSKISFQIE